MNTENKKKDDISIERKTILLKEFEELMDNAINMEITNDDEFKKMDEIQDKIEWYKKELGIDTTESVYYKQEIRTINSHLKDMVLELKNVTKLLESKYEEEKDPLASLRMIKQKSILDNVDYVLQGLASDINVPMLRIELDDYIENEEKEANVRVEKRRKTEDLSLSSDNCIKLETIVKTEKYMGVEFG